MTKPKVKVKPYASLIVDRSPQFKTHDLISHAKNAVGCNGSNLARGGTVYRLNAAGTEYEEMYVVDPGTHKRDLPWTTDRVLLLLLEQSRHSDRIKYQRRKPSELVRQFHQTFGHPVADKPELIDEYRSNLRLNLIAEEYAELENAVREGDLVEIADALADLEYVLHGMALEYGIPLHEVVAEVHRSNMTKLDDDGKPIYREDGKILKSKNYEPPRIKEVLGL